MAGSSEITPSDYQTLMQEAAKIKTAQLEEKRKEMDVWTPWNGFQTILTTCLN